ncbi:uncharacterized protein SCHCODRAFT_02643313 [Schizophyllum commune H4-8]|uniref:uncharacterized protein n=1 Tax=Schizophyllum commune (strain H4-8 / FGSC 9210) TaxID=578458 RepID=UPI00215EF714|nr:uncharacterized protein SCHCODRAFT_02643313 [Schizophyllum commune H4-8]KAI5886133.1 hypothetical protein SCHCODRAFT_02643313 [Schizophyllum commune H4-8]
MPMQVGDELTRIEDVCGCHRETPSRPTQACRSCQAQGLSRSWTPFPRIQPRSRKTAMLDSLATDTTSLKHYGLLCSRIDDLELSPYLSPPWKSLYSAVPIDMEWAAFLHPMNAR